MRERGERKWPSRKYKQVSPKPVVVVVVFGYTLRVNDPTCNHWSGTVIPDN